LRRNVLIVGEFNIMKCAGLVIETCKTYANKRKNEGKS